MQILSRLEKLLDERHLAATIDEPIDRATKEFACAQADSKSVDGLHQVVTQFVQQLHTKALPYRHSLLASQALDETLALLERKTDGYIESLLDATDDSEGGIEQVVARIADLLKVERRTVYVRWVVARHIDPADWELKCAVAELVAERCRSSLPPQLLACAPEQLADLAVDLLLIDIATTRQLRQACGALQSSPP